MGKAISDIADVVKELIKKMVSRFYENGEDILEYLCYEANHLAV